MDGMDMLSVETSAAAARIDALLGQFRLDQPASSVALAGALSRAMNRAVVSARTVMVREVAADLHVRQVDVKPYIGSRNARPDALEGRVFAKPRGKRGIPLGQLQPAGPEPSRGHGAGVTVQGARFPHAFVWTMRGHRGVFERRGTKRLPLDELRTRPIPAIFAAHRSAGLARAAESLTTNLQSELRYALTRTA